MLNFWKKDTEPDEVPAKQERPVPWKSANDSLAKTETLYRMDWDRVYSQDRKRVWDMISDEEKITAWMGFPTRLEPHVGGIIHIDFSSHGALEGIVCNFEPPDLLIYTWGDSLVSWKLREDASTTHLRLSLIGVHPELAAGLGAGWHDFLCRLEEHLTGTSKTDQYPELKDRYERDMQSAK